MVTKALRDPWRTSAAATAALLPLAFSPSVASPFWSPKAAILLLAGTAGLTRAPLLLRTSRRTPTIAALVFLAVATLATVVSPRPVEALVGVYLIGTGLVFVACLVGVWCLGASVPDGDHTISVWMAVGCLGSTLVAVLLAATDTSLSFLPAAGRSTGLAGYSMHLGTVACVGIALSAWHLRSGWAWLPGVSVAAAAVELSGTRSSVLVAGVALLVIGIRRAPRRLPALLAAFALGFLASNAIAASAGISTATSRLETTTGSAAEGGGTSVRVDVWRYARHAVLDRPVLGAGPGRFRAATSADRTEGVAIAEGPGVIYADAHNLAVEYLVTTGVVGVLALGAWALLSLRGAGGPLVAAALVVAAMSAVQPQSVGVTPLLFLGLGAAAGTAPPVATARARRAGTAAIAVAGAVAVALLAGDVFLERAQRDFSMAAARRADLLLRPWPEPATARARIHELRALSEPSAPARDAENAEARRWHRRALSRDPSRPSLLVELAVEEEFVGLDELAEGHYREALRHDPFAIPALDALGRAADERGDVDEALAYFERFLVLYYDEAVYERVVELRAREAAGPEGPAASTGSD